jgi:hypothetical protein
VDRLVADDALVAHLDPQGIEKHQGIDRLERPGLPRGDLLQDGVGDDADEIRRDLDTIELAQMPTISRALMPRAYMDTILSSKPGKRRWYLAMSWGSNVA